MIEGSLMAAFRFEAWIGATAKQRRSAVAALADVKAGELALVRDAIGEYAVPVFAHVASGVLFHLVPGGRFTMGMTDQELARLQAQYSFFNDADAADVQLTSGTLRPATDIDLPAFLLAARPLGGTQIAWLRADEAERASLGKGAAKRGWDYAKVAKLPADKYVEYLEKSASDEVENDDVAAIETLLLATGMRLPSEAEWERVARGGDDRSFASGDTIPSSPSTGINPFGLIDLGASLDVCADGAVETLAGIPQDGKARAPGPHRICRGGAGLVYPWQECGEWTFLACATRQSMETQDGQLSIRPAMSL